MDLCLCSQAAKHSSSFNGKPLIMKWYTPKAPTPSPYSHCPPHVTPPPLQSSPLSLPLCSSSNVDTSHPTSDTPEVPTYIRNILNQKHSLS